MSVRGRHVLVVGGGDTAADCIATALRDDAASVTQFDRYPRPDGDRPRDVTRWPQVPRRTASPSYALEEGGDRRWGETVQALIGDRGQVARARVAALTGPPDFAPRDGTGREVPADVVLVAIGFTGTTEERLLDALDVGERTDGARVAPDGHSTADPRVFVCGDARMGASLVVSAIADGRACAAAVDASLRAAARR